MKPRHHKRNVLLGLALVAALVITQMIGAPLATAGEYLLDAPGQTQSVTGTSGAVAIFEFFNPGDPTGSGVFDPFVRINTNKHIEQGYNTSHRKLQFDENNSPTFTTDYLVANVPVVRVAGKDYREFQCDVNQDNSADPAYYISLDKLELYVTNRTGIYPYPFTGATLVWQMNYPVDWIKINSLPNAGSGRRDFRVLIPNELFVGGDHVVLFSQFGEHYPNNGGYEEWGVRVGVTPPPPPSPSIDVEKLVSLDGVNWQDADSPPGPSAAVGAPIFFRVVVTNTGNVALTNITLSDAALYNITIPNSLAPGASFAGELATWAAAGLRSYNVTATGDYGGVTYQDSDLVYYTGQ